jgi:hypothetical protein
MTNRAVKGLVAAAIIGGSLFATNGVAFAAGEPGAKVTGTGTGSYEDEALANARTAAVNQCQNPSNRYVELASNVWATNASETSWAAWSQIQCG